MAVAALALEAEHFVFQVAGVEDRLRVVGFEGQEHLSQPFVFQLTLASENANLDFSALIGKPGRLTVLGLDGELNRSISGLITRLEQGNIGTRFTLYQVELASRLRLLAHRQDCRMFQDKEVPDIVRDVLEGAGFTGEQFRFELSASYEPREYCVQYRESDLNFVTRLLEDEGMFYFFEHGEFEHVLVIADDASAHVPVPGDGASLPFHPSTGLVPDGEHVTGLRYGESMTTGSVTLRDYNFKKPSMDMQVHEAAAYHPELEVYDYPGKYHDPGLGNQRKRVRLEALQSDRVSINGTASSRRLVPGYRFELADHPRESLNAEYVLTYVAQSASQPGVLEEEGGGGAPSYHCQFAGIPAEVPFRPLATARRPVIEGVQTAIVVGPSGEEIYTDEHGRIKVQFAWDREGKYDEKSSCWIRVSQASAGPSWGAMVIPRIGHEVVVDFEEGDPDRPLVIGHVYHGTNRPPYPLPANKTRSTMKSSTSKGGGGFNELRLEDAKDNEEIYLHGQKDWTIAIENDKRQTIGNDEFAAVSKNRTRSVGASQSVDVVGTDVISVGGDRSLKVGANQMVDVTSNASEKVGGDHISEVGGSRSLKVTGDVIEVYESSHFEDTTKDYLLKAGSNVVIEGTSNITLKCGPNAVVIDSSGVTITGNTVTVMGTTMTKINSGPGSQPATVSAGALLSLLDLLSTGDAGEVKPAEGVKAAAPKNPKSVKTGLGADVDKLTEKSPTLKKNVTDLQKAGWTIKYGAAGKGTYANKSKKEIVVDSNSKGNAKQVTQSLAHESGHAVYKEDPYVPSKGLTKKEYVKKNVQRHLKDEGEATLTNAQVRQEIVKNGGPDIGIAGAQSKKYAEIAKKYPDPKDRDKARDAIGKAFAKGERPSTAPKSNYEDYYGKTYADHYDKLHKKK